MSFLCFTCQSVEHSSKLLGSNQLLTRMTTDSAPQALANVAYQFAQHYYHNLHENPSKLSSLYTSDAHLTHSLIPDEDGVNFINKSLDSHICTNVGEIKEFYNSSNLAECKIRITSIDQQKTPFEGSILISTMGEINLNGKAAVYRFQQTFILARKAKENVYDITNDIFRLIPDEDYELETQVDDADVPQSLVQENGKPETPEEEQPENEEPVDVKDDVNAAVEPAVEAPVETAIEPAAEPETIDEPTKKEAETTTTDEPSEEKVETKDAKDVKGKKGDAKPLSKDEKAKQPKPTEEKEKETQPPKPSSWAQVAQVSSTKEGPVQVKPKVIKPKSPSPSTPSPTQSSAALKPTAPNTPKPHTSGTFLYPVMIEGFNDVKNSDLKNSLEETFGKTTKVEPRGPFALANFENEPSQRKALEKKTLKVKGHTVKISPMPTDMSFKNASNNGGNGNRQQGKPKNKRPSNDKRKK